MPHPEVGLEVNRINKSFFVSRWSHRISMFDKSNIAIDCDNGYRRVSIIGMARCANLKSDMLSSERQRINRRLF